MVEMGSASDRARYSPWNLAFLETNLFSSKTVNETNHYRSLMYVEQWKLDSAMAMRASRLAAQDRTHAHYNIISQGSGLNFNSLEATLAFYDADRKRTKDNPIPIHEASKLFGIIYSIDPEAETLQEAMDLRGSAFRSLGNWHEFQIYLTDYYQHLKWAVNNSSYQLEIPKTPQINI